MKKLKRPIAASTINEALSNLSDYEISKRALRLRIRFVKVICRQLFGMTAKQVQKKLFSK